MKTLITGGRIITPDGIIDGWLLYEDGKILEIGTGECPSAYEIIDAEGRYVSPGFIDIPSPKLPSPVRIWRFSPTTQ